MNADARKKLVEEILYQAQKIRSNSIEALGDDETTRTVLRDINPSLFREDELNLVEVCSRVLANGREVEPGDLYNVLYLAHRDPIIEFGMALSGGRLPEPMEALAA